MKKIAMLVLAGMFVAKGAAADESSPVTTPQDTSTSASTPVDPTKLAGNWGLETEVVWPLLPEVGIFTLKGTHTLWGTPGGLRGDAIVGAYARPNVSHDVVEKIDEYLGTVGYRQYVWKGLHAEVMTHIGWAGGTKNKIDGKDYSDLSWLLETNVGYRVGFFEPGGIGTPGKVGFYLAPQAGMVAGIYTNIGPRESSDLFFTGKLIAGMSF